MQAGPLPGSSVTRGTERLPMEDLLTQNTSVLIADDHRLVVDAVSMALRTEPDFSIRTAASLPDVLAALAQEPVGLVLLDGSVAQISC